MEAKTLFSDHLRDHGFILSNNAWRLSPAFDVNPSSGKAGLSLNIDSDSNALDFELAKNVGTYFQLNKAEMKLILKEVQTAVSSWPSIANEIGISKIEQELMSPAFKGV